jgi:hypothetical protein
MKFDELQKTWQSRPTGFRLTIDSDLLLREVKRNKRHFDSLLFFRDAGQVALAVPLSIFFLHLGLKNNLWPFFLLALYPLAIAAFTLLDRICHKRKRPACTESLMACVETSLAQVAHQIWLLKNVFWWCILPADIAFAIFFGYLAWATTRELVGTVLLIVLMTILGCFALCILVSIVGYYLVRYAVRTEYIPREQELQELLSSLKDNNT